MYNTDPTTFNFLIPCRISEEVNGCCDCANEQKWKQVITSISSKFFIKFGMYLEWENTVFKIQNTLNLHELVRACNKLRLLENGVKKT